MASTYDLSWKRDDFFSKLILLGKSFLKVIWGMCSFEAHARAESCSAFSSTCYSIAGSAYSKLTKAREAGWQTPLSPAIWLPTWGILGALCFSFTLPFSNMVLWTIGYAGMTADQCDIRQSILRAVKMYDEAKKCIEVGLTKEPMKAHTRGLLLIGLADVYLHSKDTEKADQAMWSAVAEAKAAKTEEPMQAERIYRHVGNIADRLDYVTLGDNFRQTAQNLIDATGAKDQALKLRFQ